MTTPDPDVCFRAMQSCDPRFDGWFFVAVTSTGIYCRPSCPAMMPRREHVRFFASAAAAQTAGYRACLRCRPDASPGSPEWNLRADVAGRAMRLIADGVVDREGVDGLARRLAYSPRQLRRLLLRELGAGPLRLARAQRAQTARLLIETTDLPFADVAFAAGFASLRQFNDTVREIFARAPRELRRRARSGVATRPPGVIALRLPCREPFDAAGLLRFFAARALTDIEQVDGAALRRALRLPHGAGIVELIPDGGCVRAALRLDDLRDLAAAVSRCRGLLDLDADPLAVDAALAEDPLLAPLVAQAPGRRVPGAVDGLEIAVRAVLGQQVSLASARATAARLVARYGDRLAQPSGELTATFPTAESLAAADPATMPMPATRALTIQRLAASLADGSLELDAGADRDEVRARLHAIPGIGPWTVECIAMRALADTDAFPAADRGVLRSLAALGGPTDATAAGARSERWRPWRAYAVAHLWDTGSQLANSAAPSSRSSATSR